MVVNGFWFLKNKQSSLPFYLNMNNDAENSQGM